MTDISRITPLLSRACRSPKTRFAMMTIQVHARARQHIKFAAIFFLTLLQLSIAAYAQASCSTGNYRTGTVSFAPATITLPSYPYSGMILWTSAPTVVDNSPSGTCTSSSPNGLSGTANPNDNTLFPTGIVGLSFRILFTGSNFPDAANGIQSYPNQPMTPGTGGAVAFSGNAQLQLVITDANAFGNANPTSISGQIAQWRVYGCFRFLCGTGDAVNFNASSITFVAPACTVAVNPTNVILPAVFSSNFSGINSTTGQTPFNVQLNCATDAKVSITLNTSAPASGLASSGVIAPTVGAGYSQGVGVQVLDKDGNPISFGKAITAGKTTSGPFSIPLQARYYQTAASVSGGRVSATATYTLTYQ